MKKVISILLTVVMVTTLSVFVVAQQGRGKRSNRGAMRGQGGMNNVFTQLNLTDEQMDKIETLRKEHALERFDYRQEMKDLREKSRAAKTADNPNKSEVYALIDRQANLRAEWMKKGYEHLLEMKSVLTPEQQKKFDALKSQRRGGFQGGMSRNMDGGPGMDEEMDQGMDQGMNRRPGMRSGMNSGMRSGRGMRSGMQGKGMQSGFMGRNSGMGLTRALERLNLSEEQQAKVTALQRKQLAASMDHQSEMRKLRADNKDIRNANSADKSAVYAQIDKMSKLTADWQKDQFDYHMSVFNILTPQQQTELKNAIKQRHENYPANRGNRSSRGRGSRGRF